MKRATRPSAPNRRVRLAEALEPRTLFVGDITQVAFNPGFSQGVASPYLTTLTTDVLPTTQDPNYTGAIPTGSISVGWWGGPVLATIPATTMPTEVPLILDASNDGTRVPSGTYVGQHVLYVSYSGDGNYVGNPYTAENFAAYEAVGSPGFGVQFNNAPAGTLSVTVQPTNTAVGAAINPAVQVTERAPDGTVSALSDPITATLAPVGSATGVLDGMPTETTANGVATFDDLAVTQGGQYTLTFSNAAGESTTSAPFNVISGQLVFATQPSNEPVNAAVPATVDLVDAAGNVMTAAVGTVVLSLNTVGGGAGAVLSGTTSAPLVAGVATFTATAGPQVNVVGAYTLTATEEDTSTGALAPTAATTAGLSATFQVGAAATVESVTTSDSKSLSIVYNVASNPTDAPFPIDVYRSSDPTYAGAADAAAVPVASLTVTAGDAVEGNHSITVSPYGTAGAAYAFSQPQAFRPDPTHKYLIVTADQTGTLSPDDATTVPQSGFRFWLVGAVTHGYVGSFPAVLNSEVPTDYAGEYQTFVDQFAATLTDADGYDAAVAFHWEYYADRALPMQPVQQGAALEQQLMAKAAALPIGPDDVIDLNLIGWSRGTIVVNSALTDLNADAAVPAAVKRGFVGESLVDPHPANNAISAFSIYGGAALTPVLNAEAIGVAHGYIRFQEAAQDLQGVGFVIPPNVDAVSDMYQHNPASACFGSEALLNLWGIAPAQITGNGTTTIIGDQVTTPGIGHSEIMLDTERHIIQSNQTLQALDLYPFGSVAAPSSAVAGDLADAIAGADHLVVDPLSPGVLTNGPFGLTVSAQDDAGGVDPAFAGPVTLSLDALSAGTLGGTLTVPAVNGVATFAGLTITAAGTYAIAATASGLAAAATPYFTVANDQLVVTTQPADPTLAQPFGLIVSAERADGSVDTTFAGQVTLTAAAEPTDVQQPLGGTFARPAVAGTAAFYGLTVPTAGDYLVTATAPGVADGSTGGFTVSGSAATKLVIAPSLATPVTAAAPFAVDVLAEDATGNVDDAFAGPVTLALTAGPGTLGGTVTATAVDGVASFTGVTLSTAGAGCALTATADGLTATTAVTVDAAGVATQLVAAPPTTDAVAGAPFTVTVSATDAFGTVDPTFTGPVTLSADQLGTPAVPLGGTLTVNAVAGVATFPNVTIAAAGVGYTFSATAAGLAVAAPSAPLTADAGTATQLVPLVPNGPLFSATPFTLVVQAQDALGNLDTTFEQPVTLSLAGQTLGGTLTVTAVNGIAVFDDLTLPGAGPAGALIATAGSLTGTTSALSAAADTLVVTAAPPDGTHVNGPFGLTVSAVTPAGTVDPTFTGPVTVSLLDVNSTGAALGGSLTETAVAGVATFAGLSVDDPGVYALSAAAGTAAAGTTTDAFTATAASPLASTVFPSFGKVKLPASATAGQALAASLPLTLTATVAPVAGKFTVRLYADQALTLGGEQVLLGTFTESASLKPGKAHLLTLRLKALPAPLPVGTYHVLAEVVDPTSATALVATTQTVTVAAAVVTLAAAVTAATPTSVAAGKTLTITVGLANTGNVDATGTATVAVGLSADGTMAPAPLVTLRRPLTLRAGGRPITFKLKLKVPAGMATGSFYPFVTFAVGAQAVTAAAAGKVTVT